MNSLHCLPKIVDFALRVLGLRRVFGIHFGF
jgi:hypothetical protein